MGLPGPFLIQRKRLRDAYAAFPHPSGFNTRSVDAGYFASKALGRIGRAAKLPPQLGHTPLSRVSTHTAQKVHSNVQILASMASGGKSLSQHSQLGLSVSICILLSLAPQIHFINPLSRM
jgi:hypothetical protein